MQRLKHAWARGAHIQADALMGSGWQTHYSPHFGPVFNWRIHPEDAHLEYGPVSTAFRDMALYVDEAELPEEVELFLDLAGSNWFLGGSGTNVESDFCRLFFAEYLADLGL